MRPSASLLTAMIDNYIADLLCLLYLEFLRAQAEGAEKSYRVLVKPSTQ